MLFESKFSRKDFFAAVLVYGVIIAAIVFFFVDTMAIWEEIQFNEQISEQQNLEPYKAYTDFSDDYSPAYKS